MAKGSKAAASAVMLERAVKKTIAALPERMAFPLLLICLILLFRTSSSVAGRLFFQLHGSCSELTSQSLLEPFVCQNDWPAG
jgi:hypothetical protein